MGLAFQVNPFQKHGLRWSDGEKGDSGVVGPNKASHLGGANERENTAA